MSTTQTTQLEGVVEQCLEALEAGDQERYGRLLREHSGSAQTIRRRVQHILGLGLLRMPSGFPQIAGYRILESLGHGGMGEVWLAEQRGAVWRRVALKIIKLGMDTRSVIRRFDLERQALALMDHPHIARVFDAGRTEDGRPFFAMELVRGEPITRFCERTELDVRERVRLFQLVCDAVQHAHQKGVIHRDLKPSNILVTDTSGRPQPKIIDFGIAKATHGNLTTDTLYTEHGHVLGTPEYMSPEQAESGELGVDTRTDVYALGVILYELLAGVLPQEAGRIADTAPRAPSTRVENRTHARALRGELDWIVLKALEREPARRYATASELGEDLRRALDGESVAAGPPSKIYKLRRMARRHRGVLAAATLVLVTIVGALIQTLIAHEEERRVRKQLEQSQARYRLLATVEELEQTKRTASRLRPAWPRHIARFESWHRDHADPLAAKLDEIRTANDELLALLRQPQLDDTIRRDATLLHNALRPLAVRLRHFSEHPMGVRTKMRQRLEWARRVGRETIEKPAALWSRTIAEIAADPRYDGLCIKPQMGLVPIGRDPRSGLYEFAHLRSGTAPKRGENGELVNEANSGLVFVLVPGGTFVQGAQRRTGGPNYDPQARADESPIQRVTLPAFFLSKYEISRAQYKTLDINDPTRVQVDDDPRKPADCVAWHRAYQIMVENGLSIPTEAMWEFAYRTGSTTPQPPNAGGANLGATTLHVETMRPNRWGFHHMQGNVREWCQDNVLRYGGELGAFGVRVDKTNSTHRRATRGSSIGGDVAECRAAHRRLETPSQRVLDIGFRPSRRIYP